MFRRVLVLAAAALMLAGCYRSTYLLFDVSTGVRPFAAGTYASGTYRYGLSLRDDIAYDLYTYQSDGASTGPEVLFLTRAPELENGSNAVYFYAKSDELDGWIYGVFVSQGSAIYEMHPDCTASTADGDIARSETGRDCEFTNQAALRRALVRYFRTASWGAPIYRQ